MAVKLSELRPGKLKYEKPTEIQRNQPKNVTNLQQNIAEFLSFNTRF